jgi:hypothetical protein
MKRNIHKTYCKLCGATSQPPCPHGCWSSPCNHGMYGCFYHSIHCPGPIVDVVIEQQTELTFDNGL